MKKIESIWHHLLYTALEKKQFKHTQAELAEHFQYSLSTIHHALEVPFRIGSIRKESKFFVLEDFQKLLYYWASIRNLEKDILYKTYISERISEIEGLIPPSAIYACYSAGKKMLKEPPADYTKIYFYLTEDELKTATERFPAQKTKDVNLFVLKAPPIMKYYGTVTTLPQTFVDIWNLKDWYGKDFTKELEQKMHELLS